MFDPSGRARDCDIGQGHRMDKYVVINICILTAIMLVEGVVAAIFDMLF